MAQQILEIRVSHKGIKPVRNGHPWIFKNALAGSPRTARLSSSIERCLFGPDGLSWNRTTPTVICDQSGEPLGWGTYNAHSRLAVRVLSRNSGAPYLAEDVRHRVVSAFAQRSFLFDNPDQEAFRLLFGDADGIPGVVADLFGHAVSVQYSGAFAWDNAGVIEDALSSALKLYGITPNIVRSADTAMFEREGISDAVAGIAESGTGRKAVVKENGIPWLVIPGEGQKTGLYCDQRNNRRYVQRFAGNATVLDAFCYHGGFGLHALHAGAKHVCFADSSAEALHMVRSNAENQGVDAGRYRCVEGDLFEMLRKNTVPGGLDSFDLIVLDPPKLVPARRNVQDGLRAYKDLHLSVFRHARAGARIVTFSCSGAVVPRDFRRSVAWAADCGRDVVVEDVLTQGSDHPVPLSFPEAEYLKGLVIYIRNDRLCDTIRRQ